MFKGVCKKCLKLTRCVYCVTKDGIFGNVLCTSKIIIQLLQYHYRCLNSDQLLTSSDIILFVASVYVLYANLICLLQFVAAILDYLIDFLGLCFVLSCHSMFFSLRCRRDWGEIVSVCWGVQEWYREIDEAVRAGVITRCPFPKPDWQTANITQTPGPDRQPPLHSHPHLTSHPNLQHRTNSVWPTDFPMWYYSWRVWRVDIDRWKPCLWILRWDNLSTQFKCQFVKMV